MIYRDISVRAFNGLWHQICVSWESNSGSWRFYKDGDLKMQGSSFKRGHTIRQGGTLVLGQDQDSVGGGFEAADSFQGMLSNVNVWHVALDATQISRLSKTCVQDEASDNKVYKWLDFLRQGGVTIVHPSPCQPVLIG